MGLSKNEQQIINISTLLSKLSFGLVDFDILILDKHKRYYQSELSCKACLDSNFILYALMNLLSIRSPTEFKILTKDFLTIDNIHRIDFLAEVKLDLCEDEYVIHNGTKCQSIDHITINEDELKYYQSNPKNQVTIYNIKYFVSEESKRSKHVDAMTMLFKLAGDGEMDQMYHKLLKTVETFIDEATLEYRIYNAQLIYRDCCCFMKQYIDDLAKRENSIVSIYNATIVYEEKKRK